MKEWNQHEFSNRFRTCGIMISSSISTFFAFTTVILFWSDQFTNIETYVGNMLICKLSDVHTYNFILTVMYVHAMFQNFIRFTILRMMYTCRYGGKCAERQLWQIRYKRVIPYNTRAINKRLSKFTCTPFDLSFKNVDQLNWIRYYVCFPVSISLEAT
jgi:hypothetical protein